MWLAVYVTKETKDPNGASVLTPGTLYSLGEDVGKLPDWLAAKELAADFDPEVVAVDHRWDAAALEFVHEPPTVFDKASKIDAILGSAPLSREQSDALRAELEKLWPSAAAVSADVGVASAVVP